MASNLGPVQLERAAIIVADCLYMTVREVAAKHACSQNTVRNYLGREAADPAFAELCSKKKNLVLQEIKRQQTEWADSAVRTLRKGFEVLDALFEASRPKSGAPADPQVIRAVAGGIKIVGELQVVRTALGGEHPRTADEGSASQEASSGSSRPVH